MPPTIDIHTHCSPPRPPGDRFGVQEALRGTPAGRNMITNYRGLPAVSYYEMELRGHLTNCTINGAVIRRCFEE
jgi:hypothetical protein